MANQRAKNQKLIAVALDLRLLAAIDEARDKEGWDRSTYIRVILARELRALDYDLPKGIEFAPDRAHPLPVAVGQVRQLAAEVEEIERRKHARLATQPKKTIYHIRKTDPSRWNDGS